MEKPVELLKEFKALMIGDKFEIEYNDAKISYTLSWIEDQVPFLDNVRLESFTPNKKSIFYGWAIESYEESPVQAQQFLDIVFDTVIDKICQSKDFKDFEKSIVNLIATIEKLEDDNHLSRDTIWDKWFKPYNTKNFIRG